MDTALGRGRGPPGPGKSAARSPGGAGASRPRTPSSMGWVPKIRPAARRGRRRVPGAAGRSRTTSRPWARCRPCWPGAWWSPPGGSSGLWIECQLFARRPAASAAAAGPALALVREGNGPGRHLPRSRLGHGGAVARAAAAARPGGAQAPRRAGPAARRSARASPARRPWPRAAGARVCSRTN